MTAPTQPRLTEAQFQRQVTELAELRGWSWAHFRPAMTSKGWRTPVSGPLGAGWFDLILVRRERLILAELKSDTGRLTPEQMDVIEAVADLPAANIEIRVWRPKFWDRIQESLR